MYRYLLEDSSSSLPTLFDKAVSHLQANLFQQFTRKAFHSIIQLLTSTSMHFERRVVQGYDNASACKLQVRI